MKPRTEDPVQAALLARWLESPPGTPAPAELDTDVVEAIYALQPERAPAPRVTLDEILAGVRSGPFAAPAEPALPAAASARVAPAPVIELAPPSRRRLGWFWPSAGALAAAAMALLVVRPYLQHGVPADALRSPEPTTAAEPADAIAEIGTISGPAATAPPADLETRSTEAALRERLQGAAGPSYQDLPAPTEKASEEGWFFSGGMRDGAAREVADARPAPSPASAATAEPSVPRPQAAEQQPWPPPSGAIGGEEFARDELAGSGEAFGMAGLASSGAAEEEASLDLPAPAVPETPAAAPGDALREKSGVARKESVDDLESDGQDQDAVSASRGAGARRFDRAPSGRARPTRSTATAASAPVAEVSAELDELRATANPLDYSSDWYQRAPGLDDATRARIAATFAQAQALALAGDLSGATAALAPLLGSADPALVQDAAFRIATLYLQSGHTDTALATVARGLGADARPTVFRSRLLALRGSILEETGRAAEAAESYREAVDANESR